jgi:hypothetical protein
MRRVLPRKEKRLFYLYVAAVVSICTWLFVLSPLLANVFQPPKNHRFASRWHSGRSLNDSASETAADTEAVAPRNGAAAPAYTSTAALPANTKYPGAAIVTLAGGDTSARNLVALLQSLRDVGTTLPIVILLARGGLGSAVCVDPEWKKRMNRSDVRCGSEDTIGACRSRGIPQSCSWHGRSFWRCGCGVCSHGDYLPRPCLFCHCIMQPKRLFPLNTWRLSGGWVRKCE